jgi:hypothetical protein
MNKTCHEVSKIEPSHKILFSICTLVTNFDQYENLVKSFQSKGFDSCCEFLFIDNTKKNVYDAYSGLRYLINISKGKYIILCHQDIELIDDDANALLHKINELDQKDKNWAVAGNAGHDLSGKLAIRISDKFGENQNSGKFPHSVTTLDENFLLLKKTALIAPSIDLNGFHLYGTDICLQSILSGQSVWVIDFHLWHKCGELKVDKEYFRCLEALENKYLNIFKCRKITTTCSHIFLTGSKIKLWLHRISMLKKKLRVSYR